MAKSKRILITICASLITFVMCTVSANAMDIGTYEVVTNNLYNATIPIDNITFLQNTINTSEINYVGTTPMQSFNATSNDSYAIPDYIETPTLENAPVEEFQISYNFDEFGYGFPTSVVMGFDGLNTQYFGTTVTNNNIEQRVLIGSIKGGGFIYERSMFGTHEDWIQINWSNNNHSELTATNNFIITFLTTQQEANGNIKIIPITLEGSEQFQYGEVIEGSILYTNIPLAFSEESIDEAIRISTVIDDDTKNRLYNAEYFYVESFTTNFSAPETITETYQIDIHQKYTEKIFPPQDITIYDYQFVNWMESLPTANMPEPIEFNLLETIMENLDGALSVAIIGELTIGWILWICVAIGALFGILKYFAGG